MFDLTGDTYFAGAVGLQITTSGASTFQYARGAFDTSTENCSLSWSDPSASMLATVRELAFCLAFQAADPRNVTDQQVFHSNEAISVAVYRSQFVYLAIAITFTLLSIQSVAPIFFSWWKLG